MGIGHWILAGLGAAAAPFTGGASLAATLGSAGIGAGAAALGDLAKGRTQNQQAKAGQQVTQDEQRQRLYEAMLRNQTARLGAIGERAKFQLGAPSVRAGQAATGDVLSNIQDFSFPDNPRVHVMHPTGGLRPSLLGPNARLAGQALSGLGASQLGKDTYDIPDMLPPPPLTNLADPGGGRLGDILGGASIGSSFLAALMKAREDYTKRPPPVSTNPADY